MDALIAALPDGPALAWLLVAALAGGLARGFSGFGAAMIFIPLASIGLGPRVAAPLMLVMEAVAILALTPGAWKLADRRQVGVMMLGSVVGTPLGALALAAIDQQVLRWGVVLLILALLGLLASGWRFHGKPTLATTVGVGLAGGLMGGIAMVSGPPVMAYLLGQPGQARNIRASFSLYLAAGAVLVAVSYAASGLLGWALLPAFLVAAPVYGIGIYGGVHMFGLASEQAFRRACHMMIAVAALLGLPLWDGWFR